MNLVLGTLKFPNGTLSSVCVCVFHLLSDLVIAIGVIRLYLSSNALIYRTPIRCDS